MTFEMGSSTEVDRTVRERLAQREQRYTTGRRLIVEALTLAGGPLTLPELLARQPALAQSSAYRNLSIMAEAGIVRRLIHAGDHAHFELAEDLTEHHHHLVCESCGQVRDVRLTPRLERSLDSAFDGVARAQGFSPRHHAIDIYGRCADCAA